MEWAFYLHKIRIKSNLKIPLANTFSFFTFFTMPLLPGSGYFLRKKAQHILIRRAGGTMFRHQCNYTLSYRVGKQTCLPSNYD